MAGKKRCFSTVRALHRLNPQVLRNVLAKFPDYLTQRKLKLPAKVSPETLLPYAEIREACMAGDIPSELDDVLFYVSVLGNKEGWHKIEREAESEKLELGFSRADLTYADLAMQAWLFHWPQNKDLLERSYARAKIHARSSYVYYPLTQDLRAQYREPTDADIEAFRQEMQDYFIRAELGKGTNVVVYRFELETWFLIRYPGQVERHPAITDDGEEAHHTFKPAEYDAVVFHRKHYDLRMNTNRASEHKHYRIAFGKLLFATSNVFDATKKIIHLEPLKGPCRNIFKCDDVKGLAAIHPVEVGFGDFDVPGREVTWRAEKDLSLLHYGDSDDHLLPLRTHSVNYAKFRYKLQNHSRWETVTVHAGKSLCYERDGDSAVLEEWFRRRRFIKDTLGLYEEGAGA